MRYTDYKFRWVQASASAICLGLCSTPHFFLLILSLLASLLPSQVGQVDPDPHPPAGYPPGGFYPLDGWVHQGNHQSASHQALHWSLLLVLSGWKKATAIIFNILTVLGGGSASSWLRGFCMLKHSSRNADWWICNWKLKKQSQRMLMGRKMRQDDEIKCCWKWNYALIRSKSNQNNTVFH